MDDEEIELAPIHDAELRSKMGKEFTQVEWPKEDAEREREAREAIEAKLDALTREFDTKDSGERVTYSTGMVRDLNKGKPRFDLITPLGIPYEKQMLTRWAMLMARGAEKYGDRNWEKAGTSEEYERAMESAFRHFMQWYFQVDDGEDHAAAVFFNITEAEYVWGRAF